MTSRQKKFIEMKGFTQGVVYACARLIEMFDQPGMALEIFDEAKLPNPALASEYDLAFLRKERPSIPYGHDADGEFTCAFCGERFGSEADFSAHEFFSPCDGLKKLNQWRKVMEEY